MTAKKLERAIGSAKRLLIELLLLALAAIAAYKLIRHELVYESPAHTPQSENVR
jgi:hypothetical protein